MVKRQRLSKKAPTDVMDRWDIDAARDLYGVLRWGRGFFDINAAGHACLSAGTETGEVDLKELVDEIRLRGLKLPVLIRFTDILRRRLKEIHDAFQHAMKEHNYQGTYRGVYPIKVNQHRHVLEDMVECGRPYHFGLEAGSKPELLLAIALQTDPDAIIVCNGFKDRDYIETALAARRLGHNIFLVVEKPSELGLIIRHSKAMKVTPQIGIRMKLASRGRGMWESSGGSKSKFGLFANEMIDAIKELRRHKMLPCLQLLHSHIGSQITDIQAIKRALREATTIFAEIRRLGAPITYLDVGGGMAVDYDGSHSNFASSANYDIREYASDVVDIITATCEELDHPHPTIVTECGRSMTAFHTMLVTEAVATNSQTIPKTPPAVPKKAPEVVQRIRDSFDSLSQKNFQEIYHDAVEARREADMLFNLRHLPLESRALVENYFWMVCKRIAQMVSNLDYIPEELEGLEALTSTIFYCNFSLFQSIPDHWAVKQLFPIMPLQRLDEKPTIHGILADITCDSDGVVDRFVDLRDVRDTLPLHMPKTGEHYDIGIFLVGAYQEILGDLHNLFGDTTVVHVSSTRSGYVIDRTLDGDRVRDVLRYVAFEPGDVIGRLRKQVEEALSEKRITLDQSASFMRRIEAALEDHTYLTAH